MRVRLSTIVGTVFCLTAIPHFTATHRYEEIIPDWLPRHHDLVIVSGWAELAGGAGLLIPPLRLAAGWGLIALLPAVSPANVNMAVNADRFAKLAPAAVLWARLPLQVVIVYLVARAMRDR